MPSAALKKHMKKGRTQDRNPQEVMRKLQTERYCQKKKKKKRLVVQEFILFIRLSLPLCGRKLPSQGIMLGKLMPGNLLYWKFTFFMIEYVISKLLGFDT